MIMIITLSNYWQFYKDIVVLQKQQKLCETLTTRVFPV